ncbi:tyrosine-protein kinase Src42A [Amia ocellicauda]|uniref:tyrosine-protein kinase Src42A n=1 Tax=Amia ocellicauda TaxID=2972642 RepID=UPI00346416B6|nr:SRC42 kinase [Amia calva]
MGNAACCEKCPCNICQSQMENDFVDPEEAYKSMYDYVPRTGRDLGIKRGDILEVIEEKENWVYVRRKRPESEANPQHPTHDCGYIPRCFLKPLCCLEAEPWYFDHISKRMEAKQCLLREENGEGAFLVWRNVDEEHYYLSVRNGNVARHYRILESERTFYLVKRKKFKTVSELVTSYIMDTDGLCTKLETPCVMLEFPSPPTLSYEENWEIERHSLKKVKPLGSGDFGEVWEGVWNNMIEVAIKELRVVKSDILSEIAIMKNLKHDRLLKLYAICTKDEPFCIVTELMRNGSLSKFLKSHREQRDIEFSLMLDFAIQITEGMSYLESQHIIHRDLRADNILLTEMKSCKIADFGLAQYTFTGDQKVKMDGKVPVKWMAPEIFSGEEYTIKCDVWSFGILLTEIVTFGEEPYPDLDKISCIKAVLQGHHMSQPEGCPPSLYDIMLRCWRPNSLERPWFRELQAMLTALIQDTEETIPELE